jgi:hypothetical protein
VRVQISTQSWGVLIDRYGNVLPGRTVTLATTSGAAATVYADGTTTGTLSALTTDHLGRIPGWVDEDSYDLTVAGATVVRVEAIAGHAFAANANQPGTSVTVGTSSSTVLAAYPARREAFITNDHASNILYLKYGSPAVAGQGIRVNPNGGTHRVTSYTGIVSGIASGAGTGVPVAEV